MIHISLLYTYTSIHLYAYDITYNIMYIIYKQIYGAYIIYTYIYICVYVSISISICFPNSMFCNSLDKSLINCIC